MYNYNHRTYDWSEFLSSLNQATGLPLLPSKLHGIGPLHNFRIDVLFPPQIETYDQKIGLKLGIDISQNATFRQSASGMWQ